MIVTKCQFIVRRARTLYYRGGDSESWRNQTCIEVSACVIEHPVYWLLDKTEPGGIRWESLRSNIEYSQGRLHLLAKLVYYATSTHDCRIAAPEG